MFAATGAEMALCFVAQSKVPRRVFHHGWGKEHKKIENCACLNRNTNEPLVPAHCEARTAEECPNNEAAGCRKDLRLRTATVLLCNATGFLSLEP